MAIRCMKTGKTYRVSVLLETLVNRLTRETTDRLCEMLSDPKWGRDAGIVREFVLAELEERIGRDQTDAWNNRTQH